MDERTRIILEAGPGVGPRPAPRPSPDTPFHIALLGDFSGRARSRPAGERSAAARIPIPVDRDTLDAVLARVGPDIHIPIRSGAGGVVELVARFRRLDDFHPDQLLEHLPLFRDLRALGSGRLSPSAAVPEAGGTAPAAADQPRARPRALPSGVLDEILERDAVAGGYGSGGEEPAAYDLDAYLRRIVASHLTPPADPRRAALREATDAVLAEGLRALLHHPLHQEVEAAWRAADLLVRSVETDERLKVFLVDIGKDEIGEALADGEDRPGGLDILLDRLLAEGAADVTGGVPWGLLVGLYSFGPDDLPLLARIATAARRAGAPFLAAAHPTLAGFDDFGETQPAPERDGDSRWQAFRQTPEARFVSLAAPRVLLRLPYGRHGEPCETLEFEELGDEPDDDQFLWGNPAVVCAILLARAFSRAGWDLRTALDGRFDGLPLYIHERDGHAVARSCAEVPITDRLATRLLDAGFTPLAPVREHGEVRLARLQSVARPAAALSGRWTMTHA